MSKANLELVKLVNQHTKLLELQLRAVRGNMADAVDTLMKNISELNSSAEASKEKAENTLMSTFVNPDQETEQLVASMQSSVNDVFEKARAGIEDDSDEGDDDMAEKLDAISRTLTTKMEGLSEVDQQVGTILLNMIGALSQDDVIGQRLEHVVMSIHALESGIGDILLDFQGRCTDENVNILDRNLRNYNYRQYTTEEEKRIFSKVFPKAAK